MEENTKILESQIRPVWHPFVHKRFSEELHYFLIKTAMYSSAFRDRLARFLSNIGAAGFCVYEVFGNYDILLRVWLTNANRQRFMEYAEESQDIAGIEEFIVQGFNISWCESAKFSDTPSAADLEQLTPEKVQQAQNGELSKAEINELLSKHLLLSPDISFPSDEYKFFVLMDYPAGAPVKDFEVAEFLEQFIDEKIKQFIDKKKLLRRISVYSGIGFTRYLIKAVSSDFYMIIEFVLELISEFRLLKIQTNTIVVAEREPYEYDNIAFPGGTADEQQMKVQILVPLLYEAKNINLLDRGLLAAKILECADVMQDDETGVLRKAIEFVINKDSNGLIAYLQLYFGKFESFLRNSFPDFTVGLFCSSSEKSVPPDKIMNNAYKSRNISENKKASLGDWIGLYGYVLDAFADVDYNWVRDHNKVLRNAATWRNRFAHFYGDVAQEWGDLIDFLADFIPVKKQIEAHINENVKKKRSR